MKETVTDTYEGNNFIVEMEVDYECDNYGNWDIISYKVVDLEFFDDEDTGERAVVTDADLYDAASLIAERDVEEKAEEGAFDSWEDERRAEERDLVLGR